MVGGPRTGLEGPQEADAVARYTTDPLPAYRYVPGHGPHPFRDPTGHAYEGGGAPPAARWDPGPWQADAAFLRGLDLLHGRYLWEAHEVWEGAWRQAPAEGPHRPLLQGLIQVAAALLKRHQGDRRAAMALAVRASDHLRDAARLGGEVVHGVAPEVVASSVVEAVRGEGWVVVRVPGRAPVRVVAGAVVAHDRVLAALRPPHAKRGGLWELPGGKVEAGESDAEALVRELREELDVDVQVTDAACGEHVHDYGDVAVRLVLVAATLRAGEPRAVEHTELRWVGPDELDDLAWAPADVPLLGAVRGLLVRPATGGLGGGH